MSSPSLRLTSDKILAGLAVRLFICFFLASGTVSGQVTSKALAFNALTINDGLSQGMVIRMLQDRYGFMWFATLDGLNRYDGYRFTVYRHDAHDSTSIAESFVQSLFEDSKGRLWIGTVSGGLDLFDRETETFFHVAPEGKGYALSGGSVQSISEDRDGHIWVKIGENVNKIIVDKEKKTGRTRFFIKPVGLPFRQGWSHLFITKKGTIYYINGLKGVIYRLDDARTGNWSEVLRLDDYTPFWNNAGTVFYRISGVQEDAAHNKLYIFHDAGVVCLNAATAALEKVYRNDFFTHYDAPIQASLDKDGILWYSNRNKLRLFNTHTGELSLTFAKDSNINRTLLHAYSTYIDRSGLVWVGTTGYGLLKRNIRSENFHHTGLSSSYAIKEGENGEMLIGNNFFVRELFNRNNAVLSTVTQSKLSTARLAYFNKYWFPVIAQVNDDSWFVDTTGLRCENNHTKKTTYYPFPITTTGEYPDVILCKVKDSGGNIWLGTTDGLLRFSLTDKTWDVYKNRLHDNSSQTSNVIFSLCLDPWEPARYLWIGTRGSGINRMDMGTGKCILYSIKDGLPNDVIYGILPDDDGNLWISTNKGLSCFNPLNQTFRNFDYKDGLQSNEFNRGAYCRTKDGCLFFGGVSGFNYFYPKEILNNLTVPEIVITNLKIRNQQVPINAKGSPLTEAIYLSKKLTLPYSQNFISFEFASMDYTNPEKNRYQYKLEGFEQHWINSDNTHSATYTNLDPGSYTFKVKGSNNDGTWNEKGASLHLVILPPWYMTWWFRTAMVLAFAGAGYAFYKYRLSQALKLQSIRDRIAGDLHDEVGSNLSNIFIFSNVAQQKAKLNAETGPLLQKITDYTQQSMEAMDDIVWMINTRNDRFENIMVRMRTLAAEFAEATGAALELDFDEELNNIHLNMEDRKNFYLIYKEAINNMTKYAACDKAWIAMKLDQKQILLHIRDNGKGFDLTKTSKGNGLFNMKKRAGLLKGDLTIGSAVGEGTSLRLTFKR